MSQIAIRTRHLGKRYRLGERQPYAALRDVISEMVRAPVRKLLERGGGRPPSLAPNGFIWALEDLSLEVKRGEVLGLVGRNGAGKSTLLKILSRITEPTVGIADVYGRVGSLLEVGTGFHPELTGRENIFLNGAILGMTRGEIRGKFDEIVAFAEIARFVDTPVKHYSSGMHMRLGFAVAAHLDPEILIVDEVLAVGDLAFQRKCLGKMDDVARQGRTVLFVSHNLDAIQRLCSQCALLDSGRLVAIDSPSNVTKQYLSSTTRHATAGAWIDLEDAEHKGSGEVRFAAVRYDIGDTVSVQPYTGGAVEFSLRVESADERLISSLAVILSTQGGTRLVNADTMLRDRTLTVHPGMNIVRLRLNQLHLNPGVYRVGLWIANPISARRAPYDFVESACEVEITEPPRWPLRLPPNALVACDFELLDTCHISAT